ncbi:MAG TPA: hypothetical protein DEQ30_03975 [Porphyromonadaceae bacterium]|nr:hypothetical protein [Porphyromonadaceae bacterium]
MDLRTKLSGRIHMDDIYEITFLTQQCNKKKRELYGLLFDTDDTLGYQAAWIFTHFSLSENKWLYDKQNELINEVIKCRHPGKRRLLLAMIFRQPLANPPRTDFLDFCLERMLSGQELPGVKTLCMKLAYEMCRHIPELKQELRAALDIMEPDLLQTSIRTVRKNVLKAMETGRTLQYF